MPVDVELMWALGGHGLDLVGDPLVEGCTSRAAIVAGVAALSRGARTDDQWVAFATAVVNNVATLATVRPEPDGSDEAGPMSQGSRDWAAWRTYSPGTYTITYSYRDLSGNEATSSYQVVLPKPKNQR